ncbi:hypothetical protein QUF72_20025 [Desulfobacterales bacterium HSG2]|nr:hypothetical protein [Desulfobacterales bacterium HSG2]
MAKTRAVRNGRIYKLGDIAYSPKGRRQTRTHADFFYCQRASAFISVLIGGHLTGSRHTQVQAGTAYASS